MGKFGARALTGEVHVFEGMTITALQRVVGLQPSPLTRSHLQAMLEEFFAGIDGAEDLAPDFLRSLHLARRLVGPVVRHMAVWTGGADTRTVGEVDGALHLLIDVVAHLMTADAEGLGIGQFQSRIEPAPEQDAANKTADGQEAEAVEARRPR